MQVNFCTCVILAEKAVDDGMGTRRSYSGDIKERVAPCWSKSLKILSLRHLYTLD